MQSCESTKISKSKHYSAIEKKIFLEILKDFKHVIEVKKSDSSTLRDKEVAWSEICKRYNDCTVILQERTVQQLKKLWANLKQSQRKVLTKEKQARLDTGGDPPLAEINIDPDIALITPHLMETASVLFSSNMSENEVNENEEHVMNALQDGNIIMLFKNNNGKLMTKNAEIDEGDVTVDTNKENQNTHEWLPMKRKGNWDTDGLRALKNI
ncbi:uncharacterized protein [Mycetomoellerius zeteki]|uniref:uncharacterized protein n=1 Tax=Mycetomoellerius zeteki TaxID=64791 RepID=UPI00084E9538|nr:PREDICTED: uncharacterized protein LOC108726227 [Trachymyrmex zeteki]